MPAARRWPGSRCDMALTGRIALVAVLAAALIGVLGVFFGIGATTAWWLVAAAGTALLLGAVIDVALAGRIADLRIERSGATTTRQGETVTVTLAVANAGRRRVRGVLRDAWVPSAGATPRTQPLDVPPGERRRLTTALTPTRRGDRAAAQVTVRSVGPLGLAAPRRRRGGGAHLAAGARPAADVRDRHRAHLGRPRRRHPAAGRRAGRLPAAGRGGRPGRRPGGPARRRRPGTGVRGGTVPAGGAAPAGAGDGAAGAGPGRVGRGAGGLRGAAPGAQALAGGVVHLAGRGAGRAGPAAGAGRPGGTTHGTDRRGRRPDGGGHVRRARRRRGGVRGGRRRAVAGRAAPDHRVAASPGRPGGGRAGRRLPVPGHRRVPRPQGRRPVVGTRTLPASRAAVAVRRPVRRPRPAPARGRR